MFLYLRGSSALGHIQTIDREKSGRFARAILCLYLQIRDEVRSLKQEVSMTCLSRFVQFKKALDTISENNNVLYVFVKNCPVITKAECVFYEQMHRAVCDSIQAATRIIMHEKTMDDELCKEVKELELVEQLLAMEGLVIFVTQNQNPNVQILLNPLNAIVEKNKEETTARINGVLVRGDKVEEEYQPAPKKEEEGCILI